MKIVIPGGSGQVGTVLARALHADGHDVVVLSRAPRQHPWRVVGWDGATLGEWAREVDGCDAVINLAGRSVNCRYTAANRKEILDSRRAVDAASSDRRSPRPAVRRASGCRRAQRRSTRTATTRRTTRASGLDRRSEPDAPRSWRFSIDVARAWEAAFDEAVDADTRKVALRSATDHEPRPRAASSTRCLGSSGAGSAASADDGRQYMSWIHHEDFVAAVRWLIDAMSSRRRRERGRAESAAERGVHARLCGRPPACLLGCRRPG